MSLPVIDVCIATYRRPALLRALVSSLTGQETDGRFEVSICIADNDPTETARPVAEEMSSRVRVRYATQPKKSISLTRNVSLTLGSGELVAMVDDDEDVPGTWLLSHLRALVSHDAEISHGPVTPVFHRAAPGYLMRSGMYGSTSNPVSGSTTGFIPSTNNCMFYRSLLSRLDHGFDETFGLTGGEDAEFFQRLRLAQARSIWCREAEIKEWIPPERTTIRWVVLRRYRCGITWARRMAMHEQEVFRSELRRRRRRVLLDVAGIPAALMLAPIGAGRFWTLVRDIPFDLGVLASCYGIQYREYG